MKSSKQFPTRSEIAVGQEAKIRTNSTGVKPWYHRGIVAEIYTRTEEHPWGIKVKLDSGMVGRVEEMFPTGGNYLVVLIPAVYVVYKAAPQALDPDLIMPYDEAWELAANHGARDGVPVWDTEDPKSAKPPIRYCGPEEAEEYLIQQRDALAVEVSDAE